MTTVGRMLRDWRLARGVTMRGAGALIDRSKTTIYLWETDEVRPDPVALRTYGERLGVAEGEIAKALDLRSRPHLEPAQPERAA